MSTSEVTVFRADEAVVARFMPAFTPVLALQRHQVMKEIIEGILKEGTDFGKIPGTDKETLFKPGAEKLCTVFGLVPKYVTEQQIEDWNGSQFGEPLFYYKIKCQLWRGEEFMAGEGLGSCNSWESKYRYRWVDEATAKGYGNELERLPKRDGRKRMFEFTFAVDKAETIGQYGKPPEHWKLFQDAIAERRAKKVQKDTKKGPMDGWEIEVGQVQYRIPNPDFGDTINTVLKMAMKRAYVAATISAINVSDRFTQDLEDYIDVSYESAATEKIDTGGHPVGTQAAADYVAQQKIAALKQEAQQRDTPKQENGGVQPNPVAPDAIDGQEIRTQTGTSVKSATPPPAGPNPESYLGSDAEWQTICRNVARPEGRVQTFDNFLRLLKKYKPEEADTIYAEILAMKNYQTAKDIKLLSDARQMARKLYDILVPLMKGAAA